MQRLILIVGVVAAALWAGVHFGVIPNPLGDAVSKGKGAMDAETKHERGE
jgi:hypothetical protein